MIWKENYFWKEQTATSKNCGFSLLLSLFILKQAFWSMYFYNFWEKNVLEHSIQSPKFKGNAVYHSVKISCEHSICSYMEAKCYPVLKYSNAD